MKDAKQKKLTFKLIDIDTPQGAPMYAMLDELLEAHHQDVRLAKFALAFNLAWKPDVDGRATLGKCKLVSSLNRELIHYDFVIVLLREFWESSDVTDAQRRALLDHELCHASPVLDKSGEPVEDERGRKMYRLRKHDIEEFSEIVDRHGLYTKDLEHFWNALQRSRQRHLFDSDREPEAVTS